MWKFWKKTEYQIVLEFLEPDHAEGMEFFDRMTELQLKLSDLLRSGEVDGNDAGGGVINLFLLTVQPKECFAEALKHLKSLNAEPDAAGYRDLDKDDYIRLWPENEATPFELR